MPFVTIKMFEGRDINIKRELCENVAKTISDQLGLAKTDVTVQIEEMKKENYYIHGELWADKK